jgi:hypothetical protein
VALLGLETLLPLIMHLFTILSVTFTALLQLVTGLSVPNASKSNYLASPIPDLNVGRSPDSLSSPNLAL